MMKLKDKCLAGATTFVVCCLLALPLRGEDGKNASTGDDVVDHSGIARALMEDALGAGESGGAGAGANTRGDEGPAQGAGIYAALVQSQFGGAYQGESPRDNSSLGEQAWGDNTVTYDGQDDAGAGDDRLQGQGFYLAVLTEPDNVKDPGMVQNDPLTMTRVEVNRNLYEQVERDRRTFERERKEFAEVDKFNPESQFQPIPPTAEYRTESSQFFTYARNIYDSNPQLQALDQDMHRGNWHKKELDRIGQEISNRWDLSYIARQMMLKKVEDARARVEAKQSADQKKYNDLFDSLRPRSVPEPGGFEPGTFSQEDVRDSMMQENQVLGQEAQGREFLDTPGKAAAEPSGHSSEPPGEPGFHEPE